MRLRDFVEAFTVSTFVEAAGILMFVTGWGIWMGHFAGKW